MSNRERVPVQLDLWEADVPNLKKSIATTATRLWSRFRSMHTRCRYAGPGAKYYRNRGITVTDRWPLSTKGFSQFINDVGFPPTGKHQLDRINTNGNYEPENVRWVTAKQNAANRRPRQKHQEPI